MALTDRQKDSLFDDLRKKIFRRLFIRTGNLSGNYVQSTEIYSLTWLLIDGLKSRNIVVSIPLADIETNNNYQVTPNDHYWALQLEAAVQVARSAD